MTGPATGGGDYIWSKMVHKTSWFCFLLISRFLFVHLFVAFKILVTILFTLPSVAIIETHGCYLSEARAFMSYGKDIRRSVLLIQAVLWREVLSGRYSADCPPVEYRMTRAPAAAHYWFAGALCLPVRTTWKPIPPLSDFCVCRVIIYASTGASTPLPLPLTTRYIIIYENNYNNYIWKFLLVPLINFDFEKIWNIFFCRKMFKDCSM